MPQTKATKKFERKHLKDVLERRKKIKQVKQRKQMQEKKKARRAKENGIDRGEEEKTKNQKPRGGDHAFAHMSVDDFFKGGFDIPEGVQTKAGKARAKKEEVSPKIGKRKRSAPRDEEGEGSSSASEEGEAVNRPIEAGFSSDDSEVDDEGHKGQLEALAKKDPEFYKFLQEEEPELLDFNADNYAEIDALSDDESPAKRRKTDEGSDDEGQPGSISVTMSLLNKWEEHMSEEHSLRSTRETVLALAAAVSSSDDKQYKYTISNAEVYNRLVQIALKHVPEVLQHHIPQKESKAGKVHFPAESKKFKTLSPMIKQYITSIQRLLENLSDSSTQRLTMTSILPVVPYVVPFRKVVKDLCKIVVNIWSEKGSDEATRIAAFLVMRRLVVIGDAGMRETVLRATYQGLVKGSRNTTSHNIQGINLMKNSGAELWGIDPILGYQTGFTFIRQLAIHLRTSITQPSKDSYKQIYNWQYVHSLDFWSRVLSQACNSLKEAETKQKSPLRPLIYPTVQVTLGAMKLISTAQYFPLRFQLIRSLLRLSQSTGTYIPVAPALYEVLTSKELKKPPKASLLKPMDFSTSIRAPKQYLRTRTYQDGLGEGVAALFAEFFVLWTKSIAFPELALPVIVMLKRWYKDVSSRSTGNKNAKVNEGIKLLVQKLEANSRWIEERRAKVEFAPNNRAMVEQFLKEEKWERTPLGAYVVTMRKQREEREKLIEQGRREEERKRRGRKNENSDQEMFDDEDVVSEDDEIDGVGGGGEDWTVRAAD